MTQPLTQPVQLRSPFAATIRSLEAQQREVYQAAWTEATSPRNAASSSSSPLRRNESTGNRRGSAESQARQTYPSVQETGTPSTSANRVPGGNDSGSGIVATSEAILRSPAGSMAEVTTERGQTLPVRYRVVDVRQLVTSHDDALLVNRAFPEELQPRDMTDPKFWTAAFMRGGGSGVLGDFIYTGAGGQSRGGQPNWMNLAGPVASTAAEAVDLTIGNIAQAAQGKTTNVGAEALRFARSNAPFLNLWYARAAVDQAFFHELQELASPGYLSRMEERIRRDFGNGYWWRPGGDFLPERAPDLSTAAGR